MQLIDLGQEVEYIDIDVSKVPYTFSVKLSDKTYSFTIRYNVTATGEVLAYGDPIRYGRPLFGPVEDERFPLPVIIPLCLTGDDVDTVTWENLGEDVKLYLFDREGTA